MPDTVTCPGEGCYGRGYSERTSLACGRRKPGYGLVRQEVDPDDSRLRMIFLTPKGKRLLAKLSEILTPVLKKETANVG